MARAVGSPSPVSAWAMMYAVAEVGTIWDLLEQRSAAFAEWQQSIGGPR